MSKYVWVCPKCGHKQGTSIDPKYTSIPTHVDEPKHHHNRPIKMELQE